jgi:hypothetical protein
MDSDLTERVLLEVSCLGVLRAHRNDLLHSGWLSKPIQVFTSEEAWPPKEPPQFISSVRARKEVKITEREVTAEEITQRVKEMAECAIRLRDLFVEIGRPVLDGTIQRPGPKKG